MNALHVLIRHYLKPLTILLVGCSSNNNVRIAYEQNATVNIFPILLILVLFVYRIANALLMITKVFKNVSALMPTLFGTYNLMPLLFRAV